MQEAIKRIKNANIDLLVPKIYNSQKTLNLLEGIVSKTTVTKHKLTPTQIHNLPEKCLNCYRFKSKFKQTQSQLMKLKEQIIRFNLTDLTDQYQKHYENSLRQLAKYCTTLTSTKQKTIQMMIRNLEIQSTKLIEQQQDFKQKLKNMIPRIQKQDKQIQTDFQNEILIKHPKSQMKNMQLNRCIYKNRLKSQNIIDEECLKDLTKQIVKPNDSKIEQSINMLSSIANSRSRSTITSRRSSVQINKPIKQKQFMNLVYNNYLESGKGKSRQFDIQQMKEKPKSKSKLVPDYKGKHTLKLTQTKPINMAKLNKYR